MKTLLVFFFSSALAIPTTVITGGSCTLGDRQGNGHHPENNGYHVIGVNGYKTIRADEDANDITPYGDWGQKADDYLWTSNRSLATYPDASQTLCAKGLRESCSRSGGCSIVPTTPCTDEADAAIWREIQTCSIMRFAFPESSGSTVFRMTNNATFQACDFTDAIEYTVALSGGQLPSGDKFVDVVFEDETLEESMYFASQNGCEEGQKIAVRVVELYATEYDAAYKMGATSHRIQHCDCDHAITGFGSSPGMTRVSGRNSNEAAHAGFVDGCRSEMPDDLSCCPGGAVQGGMGLGNHMITSSYAAYEGGGNCMRKSDQPEMIQKAREIYRFCSIAENKATCDKYRSGDCPFWRVYILGRYAYNSEVDGTPECSCTPDSDGNVPPHCGPNAEYGPNTVTQRSSGWDHDCSDCRAHGGGKGYLQYNGFNFRMPDKYENLGCDGANSTYNVKCDMWYAWTNCKDLEDGINLTIPDENIRPHFLREITEHQCNSGSAAQWVAAMKMYLASPEYALDFPPPTAAPTPAPATPAPTSAAPTPKPTAAPATATTAAPTAVESNCRHEAMAALTVWLMSVLQ
jgi:hypothetical protein